MSQIPDIGDWLASRRAAAAPATIDEPLPALSADDVELEPIPPMAPYRPRRPLAVRGVVRARRKR